MRLDIYLVKNGFYSSRNQAQEAILRGDILLNGKIVNKFSYKVKSGDKIDILNSEKPRGYHKLKFINEKFNFLLSGSSILDLGSSRGGFLLYSSKFANKLIGIEISKQFEKQLKDIINQIKKQYNVISEIIFEDIFKLDIHSFKQKFGHFDIILADLTLEPKISFKGVSRFFDILNNGGKILWVHKGLKNKFDYKNAFLNNGFQVVDILKSFDREEFYILVKKYT